MAIKLLENIGIENTGIGASALNNLIAGNRSGIVGNYLNECAFTATGNTIIIDKGLLIICGRQVELDAIESITLSSSPSEDVRYQIVVELLKEETGQVTASIFIRQPTSLIQENLLKDGFVYQFELGRVTHKTTGQVAEVLRTADILYGQSGAGEDIEVGEVNTQMISTELPAEVNINKVLDDGKPKLNFDFSLPKPYEESVANIVSAVTTTGNPVNIQNTNDGFIDKIKLTNNSGATVTSPINVVSYKDYDIGSLNFNNIDTYVQLSSPLEIFESSFTIETNVFFTARERDILIGDFLLPNGSKMNFETTASGQLRLYWNGGESDITTTNRVPYGEWTHVAVVRDKSKSEVRFYLNGVLSNAYSGALPDLTNVTVSHRIGADSRLSSDVTMMKGKLRNFRIWNVVRTETEIYQNMEKIISPTSSGLLNYWLFIENFGTNVKDFAGNNNGTIEGTVSWNVGNSSRLSIPLKNTSGTVLDLNPADVIEIIDGKYYLNDTELADESQDALRSIPTYQGQTNLFCDQAVTFDITEFQLGLESIDAMLTLPDGTRVNVLTKDRMVYITSGEYKGKTLDYVLQELKNDIDEKQNTLTYDQVIRTQAEFETLIASPTWLDAVSVAFVGQFTLSTPDNSGVKRPANVTRIDGYNNAKITVTNFVYDSTTAKGGFWDNADVNNPRCYINDLAVDCTGSYGSYGFYGNNNTYTNCTGIGTSTGSGLSGGHGFFGNNNTYTNCTGSGYGTGTSTGIGFFGGNNTYTNCTGRGTSTGTGSGYGFSGNNNTYTNCTGSYGSYGFYGNNNTYTNCTGTGTGSYGYGFYGNNNRIISCTAVAYLPTDLTPSNTNCVPIYNQSTSANLFMIIRDCKFPQIAKTGYQQGTIWCNIANTTTMVGSIKDNVYHSRFTVAPIKGENVVADNNSAVDITAI